ncbi:MAG: hypothetical protein K9N55_17725 [Phycisphaerae bacterium]|nr:hypothetical protein [Phycisphaerae bacterium]
MGFHFLDILSGALRHKIEQWQYRLEDMRIRDWTHDNPVMVYSATIVSVGLLMVVLAWNYGSGSPDPFKPDKKAWFYDQNTGRLFIASGKNSGPIKAPSGPLPDGSPAGVRAHVYSHVPEPKTSDLFVGFLEKPAAQSGTAAQTGSGQWGQDRLIKREKDAAWVSATSPQGRGILSSLSLPNDKGQTPMYQTPE